MAPSDHLLALPTQTLAGRDAIEHLFARLNQVSPAVRRSIQAWGDLPHDVMRTAALPMSALPPGAVGQLGFANGDFIAEAQCSFGLTGVNQAPGVGSAVYSVCLIVSGSATLKLAEGAFVAHAGEGLVIDPAVCLQMTFSPSAHFLEFNLSRHHLRRLVAELAPEALGGELRFVPLLPAHLARRLRFMAIEMTHILLPSRRDAGQHLQFQRWVEIASLTLLNEQAALGSARSRNLLASAPAAASPWALRRALEFIDSHAELDIGLTDIADAADTSARSLLRLFKAHLELTPGAFLRRVRLDKARVELRGDQNRTVREVAQHWGFQNASQFSQAYARQFGELPSHTRLRRR